MVTTPSSLPCPKCGSHAVIPIVYGMPDADLVAADAAGEAKIGGVAQYDYSPEWHCKDCEHEWRASAVANEGENSLDETEQAILKAQLEGEDE